MRKEIVILLCAFIIATLVSCESQYQTKSPRSYTIAKASYDISLISAERYTGTQKIYGKQSIETVIKEGISRFYFEDEMGRIKWFPRPDDIVFVVNKVDVTEKEQQPEKKSNDGTGSGKGNRRHTF